MKNGCTAFLLAGLLLRSLPDASAQPGRFGFVPDARPAVTVGGRPLLNPWAGGLNACQFGTMHLNNDAREDLVVFDRTTDKLTTFVADVVDNAVRWRHAPEFEALFPVVQNWFILADYDGDGRKDLFTGNQAGVRVLRNVVATGTLRWQVVADPLRHEGFSGQLPLYVFLTDTPAITDYDDDGDLDVITFTLESGANAPGYYKNLSVERTGKPGLDLKRMGLCWGGIYKELCNDFRFDYFCDNPVGDQRALPGSNPRARPMHEGNALTVLDTDGDGKKDLLFGYVTCTNVARIRSNGPNNERATHAGFDARFPAQEPIDMAIFPSTYIIDADGDGLADLLASPNAARNDGRLVDFRASNWFYRNVGTATRPDFRRVQKDFLQADMLELGENATPALIDLDGDGDLDLLVGYGGQRDAQNNYRAGLWQLTNRGSASAPAFELVTTDYLGLSAALAGSDVVPTVADVDGNGSPDLVLTATVDNRADLRVLYNQAPRGSAVRYDVAQLRPLSLGSERLITGDLPTFLDVDRDGRTDLLLSRSSGNVEYYRNTGSGTSPSYVPTTPAYGGFGVDLDNRTPALAVADLNGDGRSELLVARRLGGVRLYALPDRPDQPAPLLDSLTALGRLGPGLVPALGDLDADGLPDLLLGTAAGGLRYLRNTSEKVVLGVEPTEGPWAYPSPTERYVYLRPPVSGHVDVVNGSGRAVRSHVVVRANEETPLDLGGLPAGLYVLRLRPDAGGRAVRPQKVLLTN